MKLPRVVRIKLKVAPTTFRDFSIGDFGVVDQYLIFQQQVGNAVPCDVAASLNRNLLVATARAVAGLVFEVMTEESAKLPFV